MGCNGCQVLRINGVVCHETGCPDAWRTEKRECLWCGGEFTPEDRGQRCCDWECHGAYYGTDLEDVMDNAFEVTEDDVEMVLNAHDVEFTEDQISEWHDGLDIDEITERVLECDGADEQTNVMYCEIEDYLIGEGVVPEGRKKFGRE